MMRDGETVQERQKEHFNNLKNFEDEGSPVVAVAIQSGGREVYKEGSITNEVNQAIKTKQWKGSRDW